MLEQFWEKTLNLLSDRIESQAFDAWIKPLAFVDLEKNTLCVEVPDQFFKEWLETHYALLIREAARELTKKDITLQITIRNTPAPANNRNHQNSRNNHVFPSPPRAFSSFNISDRYTFDSFVVGTGNQFAHAACFAVANNPALNYNPLFLFGGVGLGKTHLLNAIGYHVLKNNICSRIVYLSAEQFTNELINSIRYEKMSSFRERFRTLEVLLLDDIQFIAGKERTQEEFFHTFNSLYESHQQIVLTSDTPPKDMHFLEERLRSRFEWGLIADIQPPDIETRVAILKQKMKSDNIVLPNDVAFFLASNVKSNIRELEGMLTRVVAFASLNKCEITIDLAKDILKDLIKTKDTEVHIGAIQKEVSTYFNIKMSDLKSNRKQKSIVLPRQVGMYLARKLTKMSFPEIGAHFGGKDHSTIIYAVNKIEKALHFDKEVKTAVTALTTKLSKHSA
jgi:chromosomal replication initiator protein